jgi:hypothetical protein
MEPSHSATWTDTPSRPPVEAKVAAATAVSLLAGAVVALLNGLADTPALLAGLPLWASGLLVALVPALLTLAAGYAAPHTPRRDLTPATAPDPRDAPPLALARDEPAADPPREDEP